MSGEHREQSFLLHLLTDGTPTPGRSRGLHPQSFILRGSPARPSQRPRKPRSGSGMLCRLRDSLVQKTVNWISSPLGRIYETRVLRDPPPRPPAQSASNPSEEEADHRLSAVHFIRKYTFILKYLCSVIELPDHSGMDL